MESSTNLDIIDQPSAGNPDNPSEQINHPIEELACCRVCHEGSINDGIHSTLGPLYHPCKCDGSIKYVHQECLIQWLKISNKESNPKCELCGENFHFDNIYKNDSSPSVLLTIKDTLIELFPRFLSLCSHVLQLTIICILLLLCLPMFCHGLIQYCWCIVSESNPQYCTLSYISSLSTLPSLSSLLTNEAIYNSSIEQSNSRFNNSTATIDMHSSTYYLLEQHQDKQLGVEHWWLYWYSGVVDISLIIGLSVLLYEIWQVIYMKYRAIENMHQLELMRSSVRIKEFHHRIDDFKLEKDRLMFAIEDFRAIFIDWKNYKHSCKQNPSYSSELFRSENIRYAQRIIENLENISQLSTNANFYKVLKDENKHLKSILESYSIVKNVDIITNSTENNNIYSTKQQQSDKNNNHLIDKVEEMFNKANDLNNTRSNRQLALLENIAEYTKINPKEYNIHISKKSDNIIEQFVILSEESQIMTEKFTFDYFNSYLDCSEVNKEPSDSINEITNNKNIETIMEDMVEVSKLSNLTTHEDDVKNQIMKATTNENKEYDNIKDVISSQQQQIDLEVHNNIKQPSLLVVDRTNSEVDIEPLLPITNLNPIPRPLLNEEEEGNAINIDLPDIVENNNLALLPHRMPDPHANANDRITMNFALTSALMCFAYVTGFVCLVIIIPVLISRGLLFVTYQTETVNTIISHKVVELLENDRHVHRLLKWFQQDSLFLSSLARGQTAAFATAVSPQDTSKHIVMERFTMKMKTGVDILIGYTCYLSLLAITYLYACFRYVHRKQFSSIQFSQICTMFLIGMFNTVNTIIKLKLLLVIYILVIPVLATKLILISMRKNLPETLGIESIFFEEQTLQSNHVILLFSLFIVSHLMMAHTRYITFELRQLIDSKYLKGILPEVNIFDQDLEVPRHLVTIKEKLELTSYLQLLKILLIDLSFLLVNLLATVILPMRVGHKIVFPFVCDRLQLRIKPIAIDLEVPVEMVVCHILLPTLLERLKYRQGVKTVLLSYIKLLATGLDLKWIGSLEVFPPPVVVNTTTSSTAAAIEEEQVVVKAIPPQPPLLLPQQLQPQLQDRILPDDSTIQRTTAKDNETSPNADTADAATSEVLGNELVANTKSFHIDVINNQSSDFNENIADKNIPEVLDATTTIFPLNEVEVNRKDIILSSVIKQIQTLPTSLRLFILVYLGIITSTFISSWFIYCPLTIGRYIVSQVIQVADDNDLFNYPIGFAICWIVVFILNYVIQDLMKHHIDFHVAIEVITKWLIITSKVFVVGLYSMIILPLMSGYIIEQLIVIPLKGSGEGGGVKQQQLASNIPYYGKLESWVFGLIVLKLWSKFVLVGAFGEIEIRNHLEIALIRGIAQFDAYSCIRNVILPITLKLFEYCFIPYIISFILISISSVHDNYWIIELLITWNYHFYIILKLTYSITIKGIKYIISIYKKIHDSKYLIGTKLTNRNEQQIK